MKKLFLVAFTALIAFSFTFMACEKPEKTRTDMLTTTKGWVLTSATSNPPYETLEGEKITNLLQGFFLPFEVDDIYLYKEDGSMQVDPGKVLPTAEELEEYGGYTKLTGVGQWVLNESNEANVTLLTKTPGSYDKNPDGTYQLDLSKITTLTEGVMTYEFPFNDGVEPTKRGGGTKTVYTFTYTFKAQ
jgi:hypothetical protein